MSAFSDIKPALNPFLAKLQRFDHATSARALSTSDFSAVTPPAAREFAGWRADGLAAFQPLLRF